MWHYVTGWHLMILWRNLGRFPVDALCAVDCWLSRSHIQPLFNKICVKFSSRQSKQVLANTWVMRKLSKKCRKSIQPSHITCGVAMAKIGWWSRVTAPVATMKKSKNSSNIQNFTWRTKLWPKFCVCHRVFLSWPMPKFQPPLSCNPPPAKSIEKVQ